MTWRIVAIGLVGLGAVCACAARSKAPETNAPSSTPAEKTPAAPYAEPRAESAPIEGAPPPGGGSAGLVAPKPADEESGAFSTLADAEQALDRAKDELEGLVGSSDKKAKEKPASTSAPASKAAAKPSKGDATAAQLSHGDPRCERACRAFGSLRRAADGVCRIAGDGDTRCAHARGIVKDNEARVAACKCDAGG